MRHSKSLLLIVTAVLLTALTPVASATCGDCYWAEYYTIKGNNYAADAQAADDNNCSFPYGGSLSYLISFYMGEAESHGDAAEGYFDSAYSTCSNSTASAGETAVEDALAYAEDAWYYCQNNCQNNAACGSNGPVKKAVDWYGYAVTQAGSCVAQCTNP